LSASVILEPVVHAFGLYLNLHSKVRMSLFSRRRVLQTMLGTGAVAASLGDEYPSRLIRLVIPYAGPLDVAGWS